MKYSSDEIAGKRFGMLTVIKEAAPKYGKTGKVYRQVSCRCDCGNTVERGLYELMRTRNKEDISNCGCYTRQKVAENIGTFNVSEKRKERDIANRKEKEKDPDYIKEREDAQVRLRLQNIRKHMLRRCYEESDDSYSYYGARGIKVCDEWKDSLDNFVEWAMSSGYQEDLWIERIDNNKDYCPENCTWATIKQQMNHTVRNIILSDRNGVKHTLSEWCDIHHINYNTLDLRYKRRKKYGIEYIEEIL